MARIDAVGGPEWAPRPDAARDEYADVRIPVWSPAGFLDAAAGLPPSPLAVQWLSAGWGNAWADPVGRHQWAVRSRAVLDESRRQIAKFLACSPAEVWFAPNVDVALSAAVSALVGGQRSDSGPVVVSAVERLSVLRAVDALAPQYPVQILPVSAQGLVDPDLPALHQRASLVAVQAANREIGSRQPIGRIAAALHGATPLLVDATALRCRTDLPLRWDCIVLDPTMWGGPSGIAVLACRTGVPWKPAWPATGADRFPGRPSIPLVASAAMSLPDSAEHDAEELRIQALAQWLSGQVAATIPQVQILGASQRVGYIVSLSFLYVNAEQLVDDLARRGFGVHSGSACTSDTKRPSHVLTAIGALTHGNLRISLPPGCPFQEVTQLAEVLRELVQEQRVEAGVA